MASTKWGQAQGDYLQDYIPDFEYLSTLTDRLDLVFYAGTTNEAWQITRQAYYQMDHFAPDYFFPLHNGGTEEEGAEFASVMTERGYATHVPVPASPID